MNERKIKIAQIVGNSVMGGVTSCVLGYFRAVDRSRFQFDFYTYCDSPFDDEIRALGGRIFRIPNVLNFFKSVKEMRSLFKREKYDIVHSHLTSLSFVPLMAAKMAGIKVRICHTHSTTHPRERFRGFVKNVLKHFCPIFATALCGCSQYSIDWFYGKRRAKKATLIKNAIDLNRFSPSSELSRSARAEFGLTGVPVVGNIGRYVLQKNQSFLIDVFKDVLKTVPNAKLVLVGCGALEDDLRARIERLGIGESVLMLPEVNDVERYYSTFDLFALPSLYEGLPLVALEAQAMGVKCLISDSVTLETDVSGECELLPIRKAEAMAVWTERICANLQTALHYDCHARLRQSGFDIAVQSKVLERFYESMVGVDE